MLALQKHKDAVEAVHRDLELELAQVKVVSVVAAEDAARIADAGAVQRASRMDDVRMHRAVVTRSTKPLSPDPVPESVSDARPVSRGLFHSVDVGPRAPAATAVHIVHASTAAAAAAHTAPALAPIPTGRVDSWGFSINWHPAVSTLPPSLREEATPDLITDAEALFRSPPWRSRRAAVFSCPCRRLNPLSRGAQSTYRPVSWPPCTTHGCQAGPV